MELHTNYEWCRLRARRGFGPEIEGVAIVARTGFSPRYDLDRTTGIFSRPGFPLYGISWIGKIFVCSTAKGGMAAGWALPDLKLRGLTPAAILLDIANPVIVEGAIAANISIMDLFESNITDNVVTGDIVRISPEKRTVWIRRGRQ